MCHHEVKAILLTYALHRVGGTCSLGMHWKSTDKVQEGPVPQSHYWYFAERRIQALVQKFRL
jgi:hypothetical protein